jgi:hypothetical protein
MTQTEQYYIKGNINARQTLQRFIKAGAEASLAYSQPKQQFVITVTYSIRER